MSFIRLARRAIKAYPTTEDCPRSLSRHYQRKWMKSVQYLGNRWLALPNVERRTT